MPKGQANLKNPFTPSETEATIRNLIDSGKTLDEIGVALGGVSKQRVYQMMERFGIETVVARHKGYWKSKSQKEKWIWCVLRRKKLTKKQREVLHKELAPGAPDECPILGVRLIYGSLGYSDNSASIDRINPFVGYEPGNVQILSRRANALKGQGTAEEHLLIYKYLTRIPSQGILPRASTVDVPTD